MRSAFSKSRTCTGDPPATTLETPYFIRLTLRHHASGSVNRDSARLREDRLSAAARSAAQPPRKRPADFVKMGQWKKSAGLPRKTRKCRQGASVQENGARRVRRSHLPTAWTI